MTEKPRKKELVCSTALAHMPFFFCKGSAISDGTLPPAFKLKSSLTWYLEAPVSKPRSPPSPQGWFTTSSERQTCH